MADLQIRIVYFKATGSGTELSINEGVYVRSVASAQEGGTYTLPDGVTFQIPRLYAVRKFLGLVCDTEGGTHNPQLSSTGGRPSCWTVNRVPPKSGPAPASPGQGIGSNPSRVPTTVTRRASFRSRKPQRTSRFGKLAGSRCLT